MLFVGLHKKGLVVPKFQIYIDHNIVVFHGRLCNIITYIITTFYQIGCIMILLLLPKKTSTKTNGKNCE